MQLLLLALMMAAPPPAHKAPANPRLPEVTFEELAQKADAAKNDNKL